MFPQYYQGQLKQKKAHGRGLMKWREGDKYEGDWVDGLRHGKGEYFSKVRKGLKSAAKGVYFHYKLFRRLVRNTTVITLTT